MSLTVRIEMNEEQIRKAVEWWAKTFNLQVDTDTVELHIERGDPSDPREGGYRRQTIRFQATLGT